MSYCDIDGIKLFYEVRGNKNAKNTILFLNGVMASTNSWYALSCIFEDLGFRVVLHDFKGQLKSDKPEGEYTFQDHAKETLGLLKFLHIDKAHLIGTSYGGEVGMKFAALYPESTLSLSIIDSVSETDPIMEYLIDSWISAAKSGDGEQFFNVLVPSLYSTDFIKKNRQFLKDRAWATKNISPDYFSGQVSLYQTFKNDVFMTDILKLIKAPTLIICGEEDVLKRPGFSKLLHEHIENSEYVLLPGCGHVAIFEKPNELNSLLLGFILKTMTKEKANSIRVTDGVL